MAWHRRLWNVFRPARVQRDIERELAFHLAERADEESAGGLSDDEARRRARLQFGNPAVQVERTREVDIAVWLDDLLRDLRHAARSLARTPAFTLTVLVTLALGIGANTAVFSVVNGVLLKPLPYTDADHLVRLAGRTRPEVNVPRGELPFDALVYWHLARNSRAFVQFGGAEVFAGTNGMTEWTLVAAGQPYPVDVARMTASAFELLGVQPRYGRLPAAEEDVPGGPALVLLSQGFWQRAFGSDPAIVGRIVELNGVRREVIGVMPEAYDFPDPHVDIWMPLQLDPAPRGQGTPSIHAVARLAPGTTLDAARADVEGVIARLDDAGDGTWPGYFTREASVRTLKEDLVGDVRRPLLILFVTMGFVLLVACSNVANLIEARAEARATDTSVRIALGSGRRRLVQLVLTEGVLLGLLGGAAGLFLAEAGVRVLVWAAPPGIPRLGDVGVHGTVLAFTAGVSVAAGVLFGLLAALRTGSAPMANSLRASGRGSFVTRQRHRTRGALVAAQVALALALFVGSVLMVRSLSALTAVDPGFDAAGVLTFRLSPAPDRYPTPEDVARFYDQLLDRLHALPGVSSAGAVQFLPMTRGVGGLGGPFMGAIIADAPSAPGESPPSFVFRRAAPGYFESMAIPVVEGRTFTAADHNSRLGSLIVSRSVKDRYWPRTSALGKQITIVGAPATIVGVVGDVRDTGLDTPAEPVIYKPMLDARGGSVRAMTVTVRATSDPLGLVPQIRRIVEAMDPALPLADIASLASVVGGSHGRMTFTVAVLALGAAVALVLGAVGIYGVIAYTVSQRTGEIGVRQALGADRSGVVWLVLSEGLRVVAVGIVLGVAVALGLGQTLASLLYGVGPYDAATLAGSAAVYLLVAALASAVPATRAARISPAVALRSD